MSLSWEIYVKGDFREFRETNTSSKQEINLAHKSNGTSNKMYSRKRTFERTTKKKYSIRAEMYASPNLQSFKRSK